MIALPVAFITASPPISAWNLLSPWREMPCLTFSSIIKSLLVVINALPCTSSMPISASDIVTKSVIFWFCSVCSLKGIPILTLPLFSTLIAGLPLDPVILYSVSVSKLFIELSIYTESKFSAREEKEKTRAVVRKELKATPLQKRFTPPREGFFNVAIG